MSCTCFFLYLFIYLFLGFLKFCLIIHWKLGLYNLQTVQSSADLTFDPSLDITAKQFNLLILSRLNKHYFFNYRYMKLNLLLKCGCFGDVSYYLL